MLFLAAGGFSTLLLLGAFSFSLAGTVGGGVGVFVFLAAGGCSSLLLLGAFSFSLPDTVGGRGVASLDPVACGGGGLLLGSGPLVVGGRGAVSSAPVARGGGGALSGSRALVVARRGAFVAPLVFGGGRFWPACCLALVGGRDTQLGSGWLPVVGVCASVVHAAVSGGAPCCFLFALAIMGGDGPLGACWLAALGGAVSCVVAASSGAVSGEAMVRQGACLEPPSSGEATTLFCKLCSR